MFTSMDKAIVAIIMGALFIMSSVFGITFGFTEAQVGGVVGFLLPILVYFVPNKKTSPSQ